MRAHWFARVSARTILRTRSVSFATVSGRATRFSMRNSGIDGSSPLALLMNMMANPRLIAVSGTGGAVNATSTFRFSKAASQVGPAPMGMMLTSCCGLYPALRITKAARCAVKAPGFVTPTVSPFSALIFSANGIASVTPLALAVSLCIAQLIKTLFRPLMTMSSLLPS